MNDPRDDYIGKVVKGKSFVDVGGLWGVVNEKVSLAHRHGASELAMIDVSPPGHELWGSFENRRLVLGLPQVRSISGDIMVLADQSRCPSFDVVHCSGVLYHVPDPMRLLVALRKITQEYLVLISAVTATRLEGDQGVLEIPQAAALFVPGLMGRERAILKSYWQPVVGDSAIGLTGEITSWLPGDFAPWWWLPTVEAMKAMCRAAGFNCLEGVHTWNGNSYVQLLSV